MGIRSGERTPRLAALAVTGIAALLTSLSAWAAWAELEEVTRGGGRVVSSSRMQVIQSSEPGIVREIAVKTGDRVAKGDLLLRLDDTPNASKAGEVEAQSRALRAQIIRLQLEEAGDLSRPYVCPADIQASAPSVCTNEVKHLAIRSDNLQKKLSVLRERIEQRERELGETRASIVRLTESLRLATKEFALINPMAARNLVSQLELLRVERQVVELRGQLEGAKEALARLGSALQESRIQFDVQGLEFRRETTAELTTKLAELSVVTETFRGAEERVRRTDIRSPIGGIVNSLAVTTVGAFVNPGDRVLEIVPVEEQLLVEVRVKPQDIAFITLGQRAVVKVTAYDFQRYGGLPGTVQQISADSVYDPNLKETFYIVIVKTDATKLEWKGQAHSIIPGMICDVDIITGQKTIMSYLLKPLSKARQEALRER